METYIKQEFEGYINGVKVTEKYDYYTVNYLLEKIESDFGEVYNNEFISDLVYAVERCSNKLDNFSYAVLENELANNIEKAPSFEKIVFTAPYISSYMNVNLANGKYTKEGR